MKEKIEKKSSMKGMQRQNRIFIISLMVLPIIHWFIFWLYANLQSILLAFQDYDNNWTFANFRTLLLMKDDFGLAFKNTMMWFCFDQFLVFPFTLVLNYFFFKKMPGHQMWRIALYVPSLISQVIVANLVVNLLRSGNPLHTLFAKFGPWEKVPNFFHNPDYANAAMLIFGFWGSWGANLLIFGGTYARVPEEVLEAAKLDGCTPMRELVQLIVPMISPTLITMQILKMTGIFGASGPIILFTQGDYGTMTLAYWIFDQTRYYSNYNVVSALGLCMSAVAVPVILIVRWLLEKIPVVEI